MEKRIAIIGSGASGITAIKCCLDEGLIPVCFERTNHIGGLWYYTDKVTDGQSCVMKTTVINTSKEIMAYSDFPIPADFPVYMHNSKVKEYLEMYAQHFNAEKYTQFNTEVMKVEQEEKFQENGQWKLTIKDPEGKVRTEIFDGVLVCTGHHAEKNIPEFEGLDTFKGKVVHTHDYRHHVGYEDKNVLVVGIGNSGGDVAVELSRISQQVYISTRRGAWVVNRVGANGYPGDLLNIRRMVQYMSSFMPRSLRNTLVENDLNKRFNHANYGLRPKHRFDAQHPTVNDEFPNRIICGSIKIKPDIRRFTPTGVEFVDGTLIDNIDNVILATGYKFGFPFIDHPALEVEKNEVNLYKYVFPPDVFPRTLAVIGCIQPIGAIMPISEIQCRWATRVFKKAAHLPTKDQMWDDIKKKRAVMRERYVYSPRHTIQVDYIPYMDEISESFGTRPDLGKLIWKDPVLAMTCFLGPYTPYQYRLMGPGCWEGARDAVMTVWDRTVAGLNATQVPKDGVPGIVYIIAIIVIGILLKWFLGFLL